MKKITIVTDSQGNVVGAVDGHTLTSKHGDVTTEVSFPKDHKLHKVEVEDDMTKITDAAAFRDSLHKYVPKS